MSPQTHRTRMFTFSHRNTINAKECIDMCYTRPEASLRTGKRERSSQHSRTTCAGAKMPRVWSTGLSLLKSFVPWVPDSVLCHMLGSLRQHAIAWKGKTRTGKSLGSKTGAFCQSEFEIDAAQRDDFASAIVTAKRLDFFKAEPLCKLKPGSLTMACSRRWIRDCSRLS